MFRFHTITVDLDTQIVIQEVFRHNGRKHRDPKEGPAEIMRRGDTGEVTDEDYRVRGRFHRTDGPARVYRDWIAGDCHRYEVYWVRGRKHRNAEEGPAFNKFNERTGVKVAETYYDNGDFHRDPAIGPCMTSWDADTGRVTNEEYYVRGERHRDPAEGPAFIVYDRNTGAVTKEFYYVEGREVPAPNRPVTGRQHDGRRRDRRP